MERDNDLANETADDGVSRRNVLKTTGALGALAAGGALASGSAAAAPNADPEVIDAPYEVHLGDGDTLANKRIVANGSQVSIVASGSNWEIRNVGIEGKADSNPITVKVTDSGGSGLIENVYVGGVSTSDETPIFVHREHAGDLTIREVNVGNTSNSHGIYASAPGSPSYRKQGGGGTVGIESCYAHDTGGNGFRIGSDGSYVKDSVAANCDNSGVWNQWERGRIENVSIEASVNAFNVGANNYDNRNGECKLSVSNVEYNAPNEVRKAPGIGDWNYYSPSGVSETSSPDTSPPSGVPMSAAEAAGGGGSSGDSDSTDGSSGSESSDSSDGSNGSDDSNDAEEPTESDGSDDSDSEESEESTSSPTVPVDVTASESNDEPAEYELTADGTFAGSNSEDSNDQANGSSASGKVWPGFTDTFSLAGELTDASATGDVTIEVDGQTVDIGDIESGGDAGENEEDSTEDTDESDESDEDSDSKSSTGGDRSLIVKGTGSTTNGSRAYHVAVEDGTISDLEDSTDDAVSAGGTEVDGTVWAPFTDRYSFTGEIASFEADGSVAVRIDGETVDPDSLD
ncbi:hypothetical protein BRC86_08185 [Halobacteriales archaeon QS_3_64_16]|nr:MAG: hypothetical protein BRC86_08185 [Halobacteriales archaeon QS_3_64_16]